MTHGSVSDLFTYPIKGLSRQRLDIAELRKGVGFPHDRICGFALHDSGFDPAAPAPLAKHHFLMLMRDEQLARLETEFDPETQALEISDQGITVLHADMSDEKGRRGAEEFFRLMFDLAPEEAPKFVTAHPHRFTDVSVASAELMNAVSLMNLASVKAFGEQINAQVDPARFRANIHFDGWPPFAELDLMGREIMIGGARAKITRRTKRCPATEVNPSTARRDMALPEHLMTHYGHRDMGVYAEIVEGGTLRPGDKISILDS